MPQPIAVISGPVPGRLGPNSVDVSTRYLYRCLTIQTKNALRTPVVIIPHQGCLYRAFPSRTASTHFPTGSVIALPAAFRFKDYHPWLSHHFSSCGSQYLLIRQNVLGRRCRIRTCDILLPKQAE